MTTIEQPLNGVDLAAVADLAQQIAGNPCAAATVWRAEVAWKGSFRSEAKIRDFPPLPSDEPLALAGTDTAPNPVEQVLAALGNCLAVGYAANASAEGITIEQLHIKLKGNLDLRTFLGLASENAGYQCIKVEVAIASDASQEQLRHLHEKVVGTSPVGHTLSRPVPVDIRLAST